MNNKVSLLVLLAFTVLVGCDDFYSQVDPLPDNDRDVARLRVEMDKRGLLFQVTIGAGGNLYCISAGHGPNITDDIHSYQIECEHRISEAVDKIVADYRDNKPGYMEGKDGWKTGTYQPK